MYGNIIWCDGQALHETSIYDDWFDTYEEAMEDAKERKAEKEADGNENCEIEIIER